MPKRRHPPNPKRPASLPVKTVMPMIMTPAHRKALLELIEQFDELESKIQNEEGDMYPEELEQNEIFRSAFELCREMLGIPSPNHNGAN